MDACHLLNATLFLITIGINSVNVGSLFYISESDGFYSHNIIYQNGVSIRSRI